MTTPKSRMRAVARRASARATLWAGIGALALGILSFVVGRPGSAVVLLVIGGVLIAIATTKLARIVREVDDRRRGDGAGSAADS